MNEEVKMNDICKKAVDIFGKNAQLNMVIEECAELIQAVSKVIRSKDKDNLHTLIFANLIEEIADVELMLLQLKYMFKIDDSYIEQEKERKLKRLLGRIINKEANEK